MLALLLIDAFLRLLGDFLLHRNNMNFMLQNSVQLFYQCQRGVGLQNVLQALDIQPRKRGQTVSLYDGIGN